MVVDPQPGAVTAPQWLRGRKCVPGAGGPRGAKQRVHRCWGSSNEGCPAPGLGWQSPAEDWALKGALWRLGRTDRVAKGRTSPWT